MNPSLVNEDQGSGLIFPGVAPIFDSLGVVAAPHFDLAPRPAILMGTTILAATIGKSIRVDLPMRPSTRTNPHMIFTAGDRRGVLKLLRILMAPLEDFMLKITNRFDGLATSRRALEREFTHIQDGLAQLVERQKILDEASKAGHVIDIPRKLKELAASLGLRYSEPEKIRHYISGLRLMLRQMIIASEIGVSDLNAWSNSSLDGHVLELLIEEGQTDRLLGLHPKQLEHLARFRRESCFAHGVVAHQGRMGNHPRPSTLWIADPRDVTTLFESPRLRQLRMGEPFVAVNVQPSVREGGDLAAFFTPWRELITSLFNLRLHDGQIKLVADEEASAILAARNPCPQGGSDWFADMVVFPSVVMVAAINAVARLRRFGLMTKATITAPDVECALALLQPELENTVQLNSRGGTHHGSRQTPRKMNELLAKLAAKGPLSRRELQRSFHQISLKEISPLLQEAIDLGLVESTGGRFALRDIPPPK